MSLPEAQRALSSRHELMARVQDMGSSDESMGSASRMRRRLAVALVLALAATGPLLGACSSGGFRPLYASSGVGAGQGLAQPEIQPIPGRVGQRLRNELIFQSTGGGTPVPPTHRIDIAIRESVSSTLVEIDGNARSSVYNLEASFQLIRLSDKAVVLSGKSYGRAPFERFDSIFSNVRAREDAENRAADTIGQDLKSRL